jgi:two-component system, OmpR family, response regulator RpaA
MENICIVDDDEHMVSGIKESLEFHGYTTSSAANGWEALRLIQTTPPDLLILDIDMPGMDGVEVCCQLRNDPRSSTLPIIFLTGHAELRTKLAAYSAGADDYLQKPFLIQELLLRIRAVLRRAKPRVSKAIQPPSETQSLQVGPLRLNLEKATVETEHKVVSLTPNELSLLGYLMQHANQILSSKKLLQEVWKYPVGAGDPALVRWHVKNLRHKIEATPHQPSYLHTVPHHGYMLVNPPRDV